MSRENSTITVKFFLIFFSLPRRFRRYTRLLFYFYIRHWYIISTGRTCIPMYAHCTRFGVSFVLRAHYTLRIRYKQRYFVVNLKEEEEEEVKKKKWKRGKMSTMKTGARWSGPPGATFVYTCSDVHNTYTSPRARPVYSLTILVLAAQHLSGARAPRFCALVGRGTCVDDH